MAGWQAGALSAIFLLYLFIAVLRSAYASLTSVALRRILEQEDRGHVDPLGIRVAFDGAHDLTLVIGSVFLLSITIGTGVRHPLLLSGAALAAAAVATQVLGHVIALSNPERAFAATWKAAALVYRPVEFLGRPLFGVLGRLRLAARRERTEDEPDAAAEEIEALIDVGTEEGILEVEEGRLIRQVVEFHDRVVREAMTPRTEIVAIRSDASLRELRDLMVKRKHSRIPVYEGQIDDVKGIVYLKDILACWGTTDESAPIEPLVRSTFFVPETKQVADLLRELQARRTQIAMVVDEYGGLAGLVTIEDVLEEIVGEIQEEHDLEEREISAEGEGRYLARGTATLDALNAALGTDLFAEGYETVAGLIYSVLGRIPSVGEVVHHDGVRLEVVKADSRRINLVRAARAHAPGTPRIE